MSQRSWNIGWLGHPMCWLSLAGAASWATALPSPAMAVELFEARIYLYETGVAASSFWTRDLDGDGRLDLIGQDDGGGFSVLLGRGDGTFGTSLDFTAAMSPCSHPAIGDLNGDARPDLAIGVLGSSTVVVLLGHGDGTFGPPTGYATGDTPESVAIGDMNADGYPDLVVANTGSATLSVLLGNGDGSFSPRNDVAAGPQPTQISLADFNRDGRLDAAVQIASAGIVLVMPGVADGTLGSGTIWNSGDPIPVLKQLLVTDVTGDGNPDLVMAGGFCNATTLPGLGDGTFGSPNGCSPDFETAYKIAGVCDLDGDGRPELVVYEIFSGVVVIMSGSPDGNFQETLRVGEFGCCEGDTPLGAFAAGDMNHDGHADVVLAGYGRSAGVILAAGDGEFPQPHYMGFGPPEAGARVHLVTGDDVDSDGRSDLIVGIERSVGPVGVGIYRASGVNTVVGLIYWPDEAEFGDLNGDGIADMVVRYDNFSFHPGDTVLGLANGTFGPAIALDPGPDPKSLAIGDFDRDGRGDLAVTNGAPATLNLLRGNGDGTFGTPILVSPDGPFGDVHAVDLDQDGLLDLVLPSGSEVSILRGRGDGTFDPRTSFPAAGAVNDIVVADFDGDHRLDIGAALANGTSVLLGLGAGNFAAPLVEPGRAAASISAADLDGDGLLDLAFLSTGISLTLGPGDGTFGARTNLGGEAGSRSSVRTPTIA